MTTPETALQLKDTSMAAGLCMSIECGLKQWKVALGNGSRSTICHTVVMGDFQSLEQCIAKVKVKLGLDTSAPVYSCYEAGRDGWWIHRRLIALGIHNVVVDSASIEVSRRARRAKTDGLDATRLLTMLLRYRGGEHKVWSVLHEPTPEQEDQRRLHREMQTLGNECTRHSNRIGSLLALHGLRAPGSAGQRVWKMWWTECAQQLGSCARQQIERELQRLQLARDQLMQLQRLQMQQLREHQCDPMVRRLMQLCSIGVKRAWLFTHEMLGWRHFDNRRQVAGATGLAPTPFASGELQREQGISKNGNARMRTALVELAWSWLRLQPDSDLTRWFTQRFAHGSKRSRRVGIVALARKLGVALWRLVRDGQLPPGARLKSVP